MAAISKYLTAKNSAVAGGILLVLYFLKQRRKSAGLNRKKGSSKDLSSDQKDGKKDRAAVDKLFFIRISRIVRIMVPRLFCRETWYLFLIAVMLVTRTYCDVWMIQNGTMIESAIIGRSTKGFKKYLFNFITAMPVIALVNSFLKLGLNELKLCFRVRLTKHLYDEYLKGYTYYKMGNLDNRIANADQLLTQDVEKFCNSVVDLYSNLSKPLLDIGLYIFKLTTAIGAQGPATMMTYLLISGLFLTRLRGPIGKMTVTEQKYEGEYRYVNSRLITNSEEIAFYNGNVREKQTIHSTFKKLVKCVCSSKVKSGANVLVCGPNGCGKSSLFRVLGELWPLFGGSLTKPERGKLFYVPQRPYMTLGTLRDQVIYPDTHEDQKKKGISDQVLKEYLDNVQLGHILEREGSWDMVQDWMDVLSGGEKQRMAMARLFYHIPQFAILDECTSAVSVDVEDYIYSHCKKVGITLFTVSHRKSLWKHHKYYLHMDGRGNYEFKPITPETVEFGS
ncbi:ATP-binding cassette sub-family D member 3-like [Sinocyclocheilus grahami]|uniref:ATP-binding cassette sub-family D member 3-like n=1 Tax=Sinocyclocheilus grahami TaxID=75366 RepID=UPI0007AC9D64|nr:PREDICTED: ATP-binding cassette sub-family D member 3-like [Sinocyclocheilus grahami]